MNRSAIVHSFDIFTSRSINRLQVRTQLDINRYPLPLSRKKKIRHLLSSKPALFCSASQEDTRGHARVPEVRGRVHPEQVTIHHRATESSRLTSMLSILQTIKIPNSAHFIESCFLNTWQKSIQMQGKT